MHAPSSWETSMQDALDRATPIKRQKTKSLATPVIVNMVSTVCLLPQKTTSNGVQYRLPLEAISMILGGCVQYSPTKFAAAIVKIDNSTSLVFGSGKMVLVSALSFQHTLYMSQLMRVIIEGIECILVPPDGSGPPQIGTLEGRTVFEHNTTHNVVGSCDLKLQIDLRALRDANQESVKWDPDVFPAAKCSIWLVEGRQCVCGDRSKTNNIDEEIKRAVGKLIKEKCPCTIKCLIFDTGTIVMTGGRNVEDMNSVCQRIQQLIPRYKSTLQTAVPREERFEQRLGSMMVCKGITTKDAKVRVKREMSSFESVALLLANAYNFKTTKQDKFIIKESGDVPKNILIRFAEMDRYEEFEQTLFMEPHLLGSDGGIVEFLQSLDRTPNQNKMLALCESIASCI